MKVQGLAISFQGLGIRVPGFKRALGHWVQGFLQEGFLGLG